MINIYSFIAFLFGTLIGSFSNVCIYRLPKEESIVFPGSHCPYCNSAIKPYYNIPVFGYLMLMGKCRDCKESISIRYPIVELLVGIFFFVCFNKYGLTPSFFVFALFFTSLTIVSMIDLDHTIIPDAISLPGIIVGLVCSYFFTTTGIVNSVFGLFLGGGLFYLIAVVSRGGMGGGDIKLIAMIGAFCGWKSVLVTIFFSALIGSIVGVFLMVAKKKGRKDMIPYGPFIAIGAVIAEFYGADIISWYLDFAIYKGAVIT